MSDVKNNLLLSGIIQDAEKRAEKIILTAEKEAEKNVVDAEKKAVVEAEKERNSYNIKREQISLKKESSEKNIERVYQLKKLNSSYEIVIKEVEKKIAELPKDKNFNKVLVSWIAEASLGLDLEKAVVSYSKEAPVNEEMLRQAEKMVFDKTGSKVSLSLSNQMLTKIGVVVSSPDYKIMYSNQIDVRQRRYNKEIKEIVQETL